jgi:WhiB family redox-sensing transcriptional regulator
VTASLDDRTASPAVAVRTAAFGVRDAFLAAGFALNTPLQRRIRNVTDAGKALPCWDRGEWVSKDSAERAWAELQCAGCPIFAECGADADDRGERWGVWGGRDRGPKRKRGPRA